MPVFWTVVSNSRKDGIDFLDEDEDDEEEDDDGDDDDADADADADDDDHEDFHYAFPLRGNVYYILLPEAIFIACFVVSA